MSEKRLLPKQRPISLMLWGNHKNNSQVKMNFGVTRKKQKELEARMGALGVREADIEEKYVRSSGPGGQNVNKTASCVYLKHARSGLEVKMQRERSQGLNRYYARKRLCELIEQEKLGSKSPVALKAEKIRKQKKRRKRRSNRTGRTRP